MDYSRALGHIGALTAILKQYEDRIADLENRLAKYEPATVKKPLLSERTKNVLAQNVPRGFVFGRTQTLDFMCSRSAAEWMRTPNVGRKALNEIKDFLAAHGRELPPD